MFAKLGDAGTPVDRGSGRHLAQAQLECKSARFISLNYAALIVSFCAARLGLCTYMVVLFTHDVGKFESGSAAEWALVLTQYVIFVLVYSLSWAFVYLELKPMIAERWSALRRQPAGRVGDASQRRREKTLRDKGRGSSSRTVVKLPSRARVDGASPKFDPFDKSDRGTPSPRGSARAPDDGAARAPAPAAATVQPQGRVRSKDLGRTFPDYSGA